MLIPTASAMTETSGAGEIFSYSSQDPASSIERCYDCDGTGEQGLFADIQG